jgi:uncharacterized protein
VVVIRKLLDDKKSTNTGDDLENDNLSEVDKLNKIGQHFKANNEPSKAIPYFMVAADKGNARAQYELGFMYSAGIGVEVDNEKAIRYFILAARQNYIGAYGSLAHHFLHGIGCQRDEENGVKMLEIAAKKGCVGSQRNLGSLYLSGKCSCLSVNVNKGLEWLLKAALDNEHPASFDAQYDLGGFYYLASQGGLTIQAIEAKKWFKMAAQKGHIEAQYAVDNFF